MQQYLDFLRHIKDNGIHKEDRTGTGTISTFGYQMRFDLNKGFPLVTTKKVHLKSIIHELLWFISGDTNVKYLQDNGVKIWDEWVKEDNTIGPGYGKQWRNFRGDIQYIREDCTATEVIDGVSYVCVKDQSGVVYEQVDQLQQLIDDLKSNPDSRRHLVSAWNPGELKDMALPPCHLLFQFYTVELSIGERIELYKLKTGITDINAVHLNAGVTETFDRLGIPTRRLSCQLFQRSCDGFLGVCFNIASYALLTHMVAEQTNMAVGDFVWTGGDCHIYTNHIEQVELQLTRDPLPLPKLVIKRKPDSLFDYKYEDFEVVGYVSHDAIKAKVAV